jgi:hypothetical protein
VPNAGTAPADKSQYPRDKFQAERPNLSGRSVRVAQFLLGRWNKKQCSLCNILAGTNPLFARDVRMLGRDSWRASWKDFISALR